MFPIADVSKNIKRNYGNTAYSCRYIRSHEYYSNAQIFRGEFLVATRILIQFVISSLTFVPWRWERLISPKRRNISEPQSDTIQKGMHN
jgi:hypothetical protein